MDTAGAPDGDYALGQMAVEVRDGVHEAWSDEFMPDASPPVFLARETKLYRV